MPYFTFALGNACFDATGDKFLLSDNRADGMRLVVRWVAVDGSGRSGECHDADGASNGVKVCDYNFREGKNNYVKFQAMTRKGANGKDQNISPALNGYITPR
ncbi:hypothetical protein HX747_17500 [Streptomyces sp. L06]|nr:hypothetical protein [Streptomyces sp. L06]